MKNTPDKPGSETNELFERYVAELEPLVARAAPDVSKFNRVFLGRLTNLAPSKTPIARQLSPEDETWLLALETVAHQHGVSYELVTTENDEGFLWLVWPH